MATYKATKNVTIGEGGILNTNKQSEWNLTNKFQIGDTAELSEKQATQYANYFEATKKATTEKTKQGKTAKNK